jgi:7-carboxy-7-deazaguanine synthase
VTDLRITEIFYSLQGESTTVGLPTVFIRLTGCPLRCVYCDTAYAFQGGKKWSIDVILEEISPYKVAHVTVTGGEPLAQRECLVLLDTLVEKGYNVSLETSGAIDLSAVNRQVKKVMDLKTPDSGEVSKNLYSNIESLTAHDEIKFVICSREDYNWVKQVILERDLIGRCELLLSPCMGAQIPTELANWILEDRLQVRFQVQLHKTIWGDSPGK